MFHKATKNTTNLSPKFVLKVKKLRTLFIKQQLTLKHQQALGAVLCTENLGWGKRKTPNLERRGTVTAALQKCSASSGHPTAPFLGIV